MLNNTGLINKEGINKKKATDKMDGIVMKFKDIQAMAMNSGWGIDPEENGTRDHDGYGTTVHEYIIKQCSWYYEFKELYREHPGVNPPLIVETG